MDNGHRYSVQLDGNAIVLRKKNKDKKRERGRDGDGCTLYDRRTAVQRTLCSKHMCIHYLLGNLSVIFAK